MARTSKGCCSVLHLREDNARFLLLMVVMVAYMLAGAAIFMALERGNEIKEKENYDKKIEEFYAKYPSVDRSDLDKLLKEHSQAESAGLIGNRRPRWDFAGSFYFVGTVVSTIGFGMTTPRTTEGKVLLIFYGFLGCAGAILFFNLFLERIITFLAYVLRTLHKRKVKRRLGINNNNKDNRRASGSIDEESLDEWKPPVYWVMLILFFGAVVVACSASAMYFPVEEWTYFEAIYFCFVAFATIGFGDYVTSQKAHYKNVELYRLGNFVFIVIGCCCIYSLFNVISIVIKQALNWMIKKMNCDCRMRKKQRGRRNAITPGHLRRMKANTVKVDLNHDSDEDSVSGRRNSGEMISMRDFLKSNNFSLALMQQQLYDTQQRAQAAPVNGFQGGVGPLAILNKKLGQEDC